ncbi:MAG: ribonuclease Y [Thermodesulfobacteriota bacterium]|nr:ribonuclease Y [Thermodesulfobacteriota bacterium]
MSNISFIILIVLGSVAAGVVLGYLARKSISSRMLESAESLSLRITSEAKKEAESIKTEAVLQAKDNLLRSKNEFERETKDRRAEFEKIENRLCQKEENLDKKVDLFAQREAGIEKKENAVLGKESLLNEKHAKLDKVIEEQREKLEKIAGISSEQAKESLVRLMTDDARHEASGVIRRIEEETKRESEKRSQEVLAYAVQRYASDFVVEKTVSVVNLPSDEMKGRIIGREGRNIRAIEAATGTDLIIDDTPEAVVVSSFDPVRREVAKRSLESLISDGRIHPGRIEEIVKKERAEIEKVIRETGERVSFDAGIHDVHPELLKLLGRLRFRTSFSQNVLEHSIEVSHLAGMMAAEFKVNVKDAKRAGLLHDIGKAVDHEIEGSHATIGAEYARKFGESERIVQAIAHHHDDGRNNTVLDVLIQAADTLSAARPGARREVLETYVKRLTELERIATSFNGVDKCYAIQAGREIRILVENERVSDNDAVMLCRDIAKKIEAELTYPGQIKVTVIRETRISDFAK